jgi:hypothetical protein
LVVINYVNVYPFYVYPFYHDRFLILIVFQGAVRWVLHSFTGHKHQMNDSYCLKYTYFSDVSEVSCFSIGWILIYISDVAHVEVHGLVVVVVVLSCHLVHSCRNPAVPDRAMSTPLTCDSAGVTPIQSAAALARSSDKPTWGTIYYLFFSLYPFYHDDRYYSMLQGKRGGV